MTDEPNEDDEKLIINFTIIGLIAIYKEPFEKQTLAAKLGVGFGGAKADVGVESAGGFAF